MSLDSSVVGAHQQIVDFCHSIVLPAVPSSTTCIVCESPDWLNQTGNPEGHHKGIKYQTVTIAKPILDYHHHHRHRHCPNLVPTTTHNVDRKWKTECDVI